MLASEDLQLIILALLEEKPRHGYEIIKALEEHSSGLYSPSPGVIYPALTFLEEGGYAVSEPEGNKKLYRITDAGCEYLEKNREVVEETLDQPPAAARWLACGNCFLAHAWSGEEHSPSDDDDEDFDAGHTRSQAKRDWRRLEGGTARPAPRTQRK